jgi:GT2 family glycosyltransferase
MSITVVIPHRRDTNRLRRLLSALDGWPVIVADDSDGGVKLDVPTVRLGGGVGFARAVNAALITVTTPLALVLNDDALPLETCVEQLAAAPDLGVPVGPVIVGPQGIESAGIDVSSWGRVKQRTVPPSNPRVPAISGACIRVRSSWRFDERFPHGFEDVELCRRLGGAQLLPEARCWHQGGGTLHRQSASAQAHGATGQLLLYPPGWREPVIALLHLAQIARERGEYDRVEAVFRGWKAARRVRGQPA